LDFPARLDALEAYFKGKKFTMLRDNYSQTVYSKFEPFIISSKRNDKKLFCRLTKKNLNKIVAEVERHVAGRRYQNALAQYQKQKEQAEVEGKRKEAGDRDKEGDEVEFFDEHATLEDEVENDEEDALPNLTTEDDVDDFETVPAPVYEEDGGPDAPVNEDESMESDGVDDDDSNAFVFESSKKTGKVPEKIGKGSGKRVAKSSLSSEIVQPTKRRKVKDTNKPRRRPIAA